MVQYKLRNLIKSTTRRETQGIVIPKEISNFFSGCYFNIELIKVGNKYGILCMSGCINKNGEI